MILPKVTLVFLVLSHVKAGPEMSGGPGYSFEHWNQWRKIDDGLMCRNDEDCNWIDQKLHCKAEKLTGKISVRDKKKNP